MIERLREQSAPGPDGIPNKLMKEMINEISCPLSILFSESINEKTIPDDWRNARVTPIYKKGPKSEPGNYRPVSLSSAMSKLMERQAPYVMRKSGEKSQHGTGHDFEGIPLQNQGYAGTAL